jgi:hypothetical protein
MISEFVIWLVLLSNNLYEEAEWHRPVPEDNTVVLADLRLFGVKSYSEAQAILKQAMDQKNILQPQVFTWNQPYTFRQWDQETEKRITCWRLLTSAFVIPSHSRYLERTDTGEMIERWQRDTWTNPWRVRNLIQLKKLIGDENFYSGTMPSPFAQYR